MTNKDKYQLCGGTFFVLVSEARKGMLSYDERYKGESSGLSEPELLAGLTRCAIPDLEKPLASEQQSLKDSTRDFKTCTGKGGNYYQLGKSAIKASFDNRVKTDYYSALADMMKCVDTFLDINTSTKKDEYLVKALIEVLDQSDIGDAEKFYVCENGSTMTKKQICGASKICLQPFLLGIWHYVVTKVDNFIGQDTYNEWCPPQGGATREYQAAIGENSTRKIKITYADYPVENDSNVKDGAEPDPEPEVVEPEIIEEDTTHQFQQNVNNPFVFNFTQNGNNNTQIGYIEHYHAKGKEKPNE